MLAVLRSPIARNKRGWSGLNIAKLWLSLSDVCFFESRICTSCGAASAQSATSILDDARPDRKKEIRSIRSLVKTSLFVDFNASVCFRGSFSPIVHRQKLDHGSTR